MHDNNWSTSVGPAPLARGCPGHRFYFGDSRDQNPNSVKRVLTSRVLWSTDFPEGLCSDSRFWIPVWCCLITFHTGTVAVVVSVQHVALEYLKWRNKSKRHSFISSQLRVGQTGTGSVWERCASAPLTHVKSHISSPVQLPQLLSARGRYQG